MRVAGWRFSPGIWPSLGVLLLFPLLLSLGFWQLDRAEQKRVLDEDFRSRQSAAATDLNQVAELRNDTDAMLWRKVTIDGAFSGGVNVLLDNQVLNGEVGYFVYTPFKLRDENVWVLLNRGWIAAGERRDHAPKVTADEATLRISGDVKTPPITGILLAENILESLGDGTVRLQKLEMDKVENYLGARLLPYIVRLDAKSPAGFVRHWQLPGSGEAKHLGYAFQWFAMAAALMLIFLVLNIKRINRE